jgi:hypothetical protein
MKLIQIVPADGFRLYSAMVKKQAEIRKSNRGTFFRSGKKSRGSTRWTHVSHKGWINLERGLSEVVTAQVQSRVETDEWQMLTAFLGWLDRHFGGDISSVNIHYR